MKLSRLILLLTCAATTGAPLPAADPTPVQIGKPLAQSKVPPVTAQGRFLSPQAVSAVDISADGRRIAVATMAFRHDRNVWTLADDGKVLSSRYVLPWAPFQVAAAGKGSALAVGLAYARITPPYPTTVLFPDDKADEMVLTDHAGERGWLRYGTGDWRTGWLVSSLGDQVVRAGDTVLTIGTDKGAWQLIASGAQKLPGAFTSERPYRLAASGDGRIVAATYIVPDVSRLEKGTVPESVRAHVPKALVTWRSIADGKEFGSIKPSEKAAALAPLPDPVKDFPELAEKFALRPDAVIPFWVAASVALSADGSRIALTEYAGWLWVRGKPAIGKWDPPYHLIPFVPRQRGWLRIVSNTGEELVRTQLPREGLFDVRLDDRGDRAWCYPQSWFARGMAGAAWLPADPVARTVFGFDHSAKDWTVALSFPDAVSDLALQPDGERLLVSCWEGSLYLVDAAGKPLASVDVNGPARVQWNRAGRCAVAGTSNGEVLRLDADGKERWRVKLPEADLPPLKQPVPRVFDEVPIYQVGRTGPEHAYVGDTWLIKTDSCSFLIDTGGTSSIPITLQRMKSVGVDLKDVPYLLHTHSHGDHCGAGYLWRARGLKVVAPESADFTLAWLMPTLTDYGVWPPRPVDWPLPLKRVGDEKEIMLGNLKVRAIFVPGHSFDSVLWAMELDGKRVLFTGDIGFDNQDILHRCWGDVDKAKAVTDVVRTKVLPWKPDFVFRGHGAKRDGTAFLEDLVKRSEAAIQAEREKK